MILILNAGSSSIKFALFLADTVPGADNLLCDGQMSGIGHSIHFHAVDGAHHTLVNDYLPQGVDHEQAVARLLQWIGSHYANNRLVGAGHRVVHGGARYIRSTLIDDVVLAELRHLIPLAPLHQPHHIAAIEALQKLYPALPQAACFDTAFHHTNAALATAYALPRALSEQGIRRYGFHGLSYEYIASVMEATLGAELAQGRVVVAHLGAGASMCAMANRQSVASTMGFTALDGLPMSRRCGTLDPGVVLYLIDELRMSTDQVAHLLYNDCGLFGVSGVSDDMKTLEESSDAHAREAIDLFVYRINRELGSLVAALGGLDALIFTAGIGEHAAALRSQVSQAAAWTGLQIDAQLNAQHATRLSGPNARVSAWVIPTNEDLMIAQHAWRLLFR